MPYLDADQALECFKKLLDSTKLPLSESDTRAKIIDPIFKDCLGWDEDDISREDPIHKGFIDYVFKINDREIFVLEAKRTGRSFTIPKGFKKKRWKISGSISTDNKIKEAIEQAHRYSIESGTTFAVVSNGEQFIIFESFKRYGKWRDGYCVVFKSLKDIIDNFTLFWNILSKEAVISGSLRERISEEVIPLEFKRPLDFIHNEDAASGVNFLATHLTPITRSIFSDLTDDKESEMLRKCYVRQKQLVRTDHIIKSSFDRLPHYAKQFDINWFRESETDSGQFQLSFEKCREFLSTKTPIGSIIVLLGGIGCGKTTFIHHFFKIVLGDRDDILWFYVDFGKSPPDLKDISEFIYNSIIEHYQKHFMAELGDYLKSVGVNSVEPNSESILVLFSMLRYKGYTISIVLDNVDQHSYTSPEYQERVFELAQNLTHKFKTITILTLREESFFRSTRSGVLDAYQIPKFHIESPDFEELLRNRINYTLNFLSKDKEKLIKLTGSPFAKFKTIELFFKIIKNSIRKNRRVGRDILRFINNISGGDMRQALRHFNTFVTSGKTDIDEMINIELSVPPDSPPHYHYQIPLHHIVRSIILGNYLHYTSSHSNIVNLYQVNPQYTNSHFIHLKILDYLLRRTNYFVALEPGFVDIDQIITAAEIGGINQRAIEDSLKKLSHYGLVEYNNQNKDGYETAVYVRITDMGKYYIERLINTFSYSELMLGDTPICGRNTIQELRGRLFVERIRNKMDRMQVRFARTEIFLEHLKDREEDEFEKSPELLSSDLTKTRFMDKILQAYFKEKKYILEKLLRRQEVS